MFARLDQFSILSMVLLLRYRKKNEMCCSTPALLLVEHFLEDLYGKMLLKTSKSSVKDLSLFNLIFRHNNSCNIFSGMLKHALYTFLIDRDMVK